MPAYRTFRLFTHALTQEQAAQFARSVAQFHEVQSALALVPAGERSLPLHGRLVDSADLPRAATPETPEITATGASFVDNWFSHTHVDRALLNVGDWEFAFSDDLSLPAYGPDAYVLASFALISFLLCCRVEDRHYLHLDTTGCLLDLCARRAERAIKMRSGYICALCKARAAAAGVSPVEIDAIQAIVERVRLLTLGRRPQVLRSSGDAASDAAFLQEAVLPAGVRLPPPLLAASRHNRGLTLCIGSGLSMQTDVQVKYRDTLPWRTLPRWTEVSERMAALLKQYRAREQPPRAYETLTEYLTDLDFFRTALGERAYYPRAIFDIFAPVITAPGRANRLVFQLPLRWVLTTNYDFVLNVAAPPGTASFTWKEARQAREYLELSGHRAPLLKIHGCASRPDTIVLTQSEYQTMRRSDEYVALMRFVFDVQAVLFVGFGFTDPLDLDLALEQAELAGAAQGEKFALVPAASARTLRDRFANVQVISYERHEDLAAILAVLARETGSPAA